MDRGNDLLAPESLLYSGCAALAAIPLALYLAVLGQGLGACLGGCQWIGLSLPVDRQVWALVNQPAMNFAARGAAFGYWLGAVILPLLVATCAVPFLPRRRSAAAELLLLHIAWAAATVGCAWLPLLDSADGHLLRWLEVHRLPTELVWLGPIAAAGAAIVPALHLLALAQVARRDLRRLTRLTMVLIHLGVPLLAWVIVATIARGKLAAAPSIAVLLPLGAAGAVAWSGYPSTLVHTLGELTVGGYLRALTLAACVLAGIWFAGRPLGEDRRAGILWGQPSSFNNVRTWITAVPLHQGVFTPSWSPQEGSRDSVSGRD